MNYLTGLFFLPFAAIETRPPIWEDVEYQLVGFFVVVIALATIWLSVEFFGWLFRRVERRQSEQESLAPVPEALEPGAPPASPELIAVIAAAVDTIVPEPHQIVTISLVEDHPTFSTLSQSAWSVEGRRQIYSSHKIR